MGDGMTEGRIQDAVRIALSVASPEGHRLVLWRNNCGVAVTRNATIRYGVGNPGGADLIGLYRGRFVAVEIKRPGKKQTPEQLLFASLVRRTGGIYAVIHSVEEATQWLAELRTLCL